MAYQIVVQEKKDYFYIAVEGGFNSNSVMDIRKTAESAISHKYINLFFDLSKVTELDSSGIGLLTTLYKKITSLGGQICLIKPSLKISESINSCGIGKVIPIYTTRQEAESTLTEGLNIQDRGYYVLVTLPSEFNITVIKPLRQAITEAINAGHCHIAFDFSITAYVSSVGIGILMNLEKQSRERGGGVYLVNLPENTRDMLDATNVLGQLREFDTIADLEDQLV